MKAFSLAVLLGGVISLATAAVPLRVGPVSSYGTLGTSGNKVISLTTKKQVMLRGMSLFWSDATGSPYYNENVIAWATQNLGIDVFRFAMAIESYDSDGGNSNEGKVSSGSAYKTRERLESEKARAESAGAELKERVLDARENLAQAAKEREQMMTEKRQELFAWIARHRHFGAGRLLRAFPKMQHRAYPAKIRELQEYLQNFRKNK